MLGWSCLSQLFLNRMVRHPSLVPHDKGSEDGVSVEMGDLVRDLFSPR